MLCVSEDTEVVFLPMTKNGYLAKVKVDFQRIRCVKRNLIMHFL